MKFPVQAYLMGLWVLLGCVLLFFNVWAGLGWLVGGLIRPQMSYELEQLSLAVVDSVWSSPHDQGEEDQKKDKDYPLKG